MKIVAEKKHEFRGGVEMQEADTHSPDKRRMRSCSYSNIRIRIIC